MFLTNTTLHRIRAGSGDITDGITVETDQVLAIFGQMIKAITSAAGLWLVVILDTEKELPEAEITRDRGSYIHTVMAHAIEDIGKTLNPSTAGRVDTAILLQTMVQSCVRQLLRGVLHSHKNKLSSSRMRNGGTISHNEGGLTHKKVAKIRVGEGDVNCTTGCPLETTNCRGWDAITD